MTDLTITNGELRLAASVFGPKGAPTVLCLHGITNSRDTWQETVQHLCDRFRVWTVDFRGHGHSDRCDTYCSPQYVSDAIAAVEFIARPTVVIGHSLGALAATMLAQQPHPLVRAVLLEDPPTYLGIREEFDQSDLAVVFPMVRDAQLALREQDVALSHWVQMIANAPDPRGGVAADHYDERNILSFASALQRHDPASWPPVFDLTGFEGFDPDLPIQTPVTLLRADPALGSTLLAGHEQRFIETNPHTELIEFPGVTHRIHASKSAQARFLEVAEAFVRKHAVQG